MEKTGRLDFRFSSVLGRLSDHRAKTSPTSPGLVSPGILINALGAGIWPKMYFAISSYGEIL